MFHGNKDNSYSQEKLQIEVISRINAKLLWSKRIYKESIHELSSINCIITKIDGVKYNQIPKTREIGSKLPNALSVTLPETISCSGTGVSTRKKLELKRKN